MSDVDPVLLLATTDAASRDVLGSELRRRYGGDYEVVVCADYAHARAVLEGLRRWQRAGGAGHRLLRPGRPGRPRLPAPRLLAAPVGQAGDLRAIWGDFASTTDVFAAIGQGHAELVLLRPERPARRGVPRRDHRRAGRLAPGPGHRLRGRPDHRRAARRAHPRAARPVRSQPHPGGLPPGRHGVGRPAAGRAGLTDPELPVVQLAFTSPPTTLVAPTDLEIADAFGLMAPLPPDRVYDVVVVGAGPERPGRGGLRLVRGAVDAGGRAGRGRRAGRHVARSSATTRASRAASAAPTWPSGPSSRRGPSAPSTPSCARSRRSARRATCGRSRCPTAAASAAAASSSPPASTTAASSVPALEGLVGRGVFYGAAVAEAPSMARDGGYVDRRRQLGRAGGPPPGPLRAPRDAAGARAVARGEHVGVPDRAARRHAQRRHPLRHGGARTGASEDGCLAGAHAAATPHGGPGEAEEVPAGGLFVLIGSVPRTAWLPAEIERDAGRASSVDRAAAGGGLPLWRRACRASSPSATCAPGRSSGSRRPSGTARRSSRRCTATSRRTRRRPRPHEPAPRRDRRAGHARRCACSSSSRRCSCSSPASS